MPGRSALHPTRMCGAFPLWPYGERRGERASEVPLRKSPRPRRTRRRRRTKGCSRAPKEAYVGVLMRANRDRKPDFRQCLAWCYHVARLTHPLDPGYGADLPTGSVRNSYMRAVGRSAEEVDVASEGTNRQETGQKWPHFVSGRDRRGWDKSTDVLRPRLTRNGSFSVRF